MENEGDMVAACDLADDLRDAIVEYQVSIGFGRHALDSSLIQIVVLAARGDLWAELQVDCKPQDPHFEKALDAD